MCVCVCVYVCLRLPVKVEDDVSMAEFEEGALQKAGHAIPEGRSQSLVFSHHPVVRIFVLPDRLAREHIVLLLGKRAGNEPLSKA